MRIVIPALSIHLAAVIADVLAAAMMSTVPGRSKWIVVGVATICAMQAPSSVPSRPVGVRWPYARDRATRGMYNRIVPLSRGW